MNNGDESLRRSGDTGGGVARGHGAARAADPSAEKARAHFQQGDTYFKLDKYPVALQEFEQAYLAKQDPSFLYNIAQCHRLMGNRVEAIRFYKRYLNDAPTAPNRPVAEKHIRDLESAVSAEELTGDRMPQPATAPGGEQAGTGRPCARRRRGRPPQAVALEARTAGRTRGGDRASAAGTLVNRRPSGLH